MVINYGFYNFYHLGQKVSLFLQLSLPLCLSIYLSVCLSLSLLLSLSFLSLSLSLCLSLSAPTRRGGRGSSVDEPNDFLLVGSVSVYRDLLRQKSSSPRFGSAWHHVKMSDISLGTLVGNCQFADEDDKNLVLALFLSS